jgi:hypothetical protein
MRSILHSLWSSPTGDVVEQQLSLPSLVTQHKNALRLQRLQQYARALNESFEKVSRTSCWAVLAKLTCSKILGHLRRCFVL